ncbi:hypothetical protein E2C01_024941 [Portunus trituberculatus]|uniref:Uncharacterized protein n=1 Tax=Portunus trituberculatus TaxID=210409 RepID=A0A5B7EEA1_PORTR|nr:hypothetical protein [Portunus trituberculatus]
MAAVHVLLLPHLQHTGDICGGLVSLIHHQHPASLDGHHQRRVLVLNEPLTHHRLDCQTLHCCVSVLVENAGKKHYLVNIKEKSVRNLGGIVRSVDLSMGVPNPQHSILHLTHQLPASQFLGFCDASVLQCYV